MQAIPRTWRLQHLPVDVTRTFRGCESPCLQGRAGRLLLSAVLRADVTGVENTARMTGDEIPVTHGHGVTGFGYRGSRPKFRTVSCKTVKCHVVDSYPSLDVVIVTQPRCTDIR